MKRSIVIYDSWGELIRNLPVEAAGTLIQMICDYSFGDGVLPSENDMIDAMFLMIKSKLDEDSASYEETVKKRSEAGKKGMEKRWKDNKDITEDNNVIAKDNTVKEGVTNITDSVSVSVSDSVSDKDKKKRVRFTPPTLEEVEAYCKKRNSPVNPKDFFEYFDTGHWIDSKGDPVRNWKQKLITWEKHAKGKPPDRPPDKPKGHFATERQYDFEAIERQFVKGAV